MEMNVPFLGEIELDPHLGKACDSGKSFIQNFPDSRVSIAYKRICKGKVLFYNDSVIICFYCFPEALLETIPSIPA